MAVTFRAADVRIYIGFGIAALLLAGFGVLAEQMTDGDTAAFDEAVVLLFRASDNPELPLGPQWFVEAVRDITALGSFSVLGIVTAGVVLHLLLTGAGRMALVVLLSVIGGTIISTVLKALFDRPRPDLFDTVHVFTASFPSGHATVSAVVYLTIGVLLAERAKTWPSRLLYLAGAMLLTIFIGISRLYLGVHFPTDVLAGWSIGAAWALLCLGVAHMLRTRGGLKDVPPPGPAT